MSRPRIQSVPLFIMASSSILALAALVAGQTSESLNIVPIQADVVATGIPGAGAIAQIGTFHAGGPFHDRVDFAAFTQPGQVLDRTRLFVASTSNFGAPLARQFEAPGSILSLDVSGDTVAVPA